MVEAENIFKSQVTIYPSYKHTVEVVSRIKKKRPDLHIWEYVVAKNEQGYNYDAILCALQWLEFYIDRLQKVDNWKEIIERELTK